MTNDQAKNLRKKMKMNVQLQKQAKTIAFISGKGGVGKSNVAINFAIQLAKRNHRVLIIDLDVGMGNIDVLLGMRAKHSIVDALEHNHSIEQVIQKGPGDIDYIAGGSSLTKLFMLNNEYEHYFLSVFAILVQKYDYLIFDLGAGLTEESLFFIRASDEVILITTPEPTAITDGYSIVKTLVKYTQNLPIHVVMNRSISIWGGTKALDKFSEIISTFLHLPISKLAIIPDDSLVREAVMHQVPFSIKYRKSSATKAIEKMTSTFLNKGAVETTERPLSFIHKLSHLLGGKKL